MNYELRIMNEKLAKQRHVQKRMVKVEYLF